MKRSIKLQLATTAVVTAATTLVSLVVPTTSSAWSTGGYPSFGMCPNPGGQVVASYDDGNHWIAGESFLRWGSDKVYNKGNDNYTQCYCPELPNTQTPDNTKPGIQSDWLKESSVSTQVATSLKRAGWIEENGADFGLVDAPYLVLNHPFLCNSTCYPSHPKPTWYPTPTKHPTPTWYQDPQQDKQHMPTSSVTITVSPTATYHYSLKK